MDRRRAGIELPGEGLANCLMREWNLVEEVKSATWEAEDEEELEMMMKGERRIENWITPGTSCQGQGLNLVERGKVLLKSGEEETVRRL